MKWLWNNIEIIFVAIMVITIPALFLLDGMAKPTPPPTNATCTETSLDKYIFQNGCVTK